jgi:hypothetical protein
MPKYKISLKSVQWEPSCFMLTDGQTDMRNLIVAFRNFANAPNKTADDVRREVVRRTMAFFTVKISYDFTVHP